MMFGDHSFTAELAGDANLTRGTSNVRTEKVRHANTNRFLPLIRN
jgi:hypothetical protein